MRIKLIVIAVAIAALAVGVGSSSATLNSETSAKVSLKAAGAPASVKIVIDNTDSLYVPEPIKTVSIASSAAKWNSKAVAQCKSKVPTNADNDNNAAEIVPACPKASKVGTGKFTANTGKPGFGVPIPADFGKIDGTLNIYNYKPAAGSQATLLLEIMSDTPVPNAHQYTLAKVSKTGVIAAIVPTMEDLPPAVKNILSTPADPRVIAMSHIETTIKSPTPKKGTKPFLTLKSLKNIDLRVTLQR